VINHGIELPTGWRMFAQSYKAFLSIKSSMLEEMRIRLPMC